jgi:hypothetical protein
VRFGYPSPIFRGEYDWPLALQSGKGFGHTLGPALRREPLPDQRFQLGCLLLANVLCHTIGILNLATLISKDQADRLLGPARSRTFHEHEARNFRQGGH